MSLTLILAGTTLWAQQVDIHGTVLDDLGEGLPGATVKEKGNESNGTLTDMDGNFTLKVEKGAILVISFMGFDTQEVEAKDGMTITMGENVADMNELVVTGYQVQRKADLTGAVSVVSVDELAKQNENNPIKAMQGRVPGMNISADGNPSGTATVRIRGIGTLNNNDPLYIIDGVPTKAGMHELNGNDIESIQVLKDAASASIYGSRAANGVIIITTKRGKEGKVKIDFDASVAVQTYANRMEVLNAKQFGQVMWQGYVNDGLDPNMNGLGYHYDWTYNQQGVPVLNGITMSKYLDAAGTTPAADTDWFDQTTRTGIVQKYDVSLSNGSEKGSSFFSLGYYKNLGIIKESDFSRFSARMNSDYKLLKINERDIITVGEHFTVNRTSEVQAPGGFLENVLQFNPSLPVYTTDGSFAGPVGGYPDRENPLARLTRNADNRYTYWRMFGDAFININPFKNFNVKSTFGLDFAQKQQRIFTYPITEGTVANSTNAVEPKQEHWTKWMWNAVASYSFEAGKNHFDALAGVELNREDDSWFSGKAYDFAVLNPSYMWPDAAVGEAEAYGGAGGFSLVSFFAKANYNFANRYLASVTVRHDGSSRFGKNNRYGTFPSFSAGWRISQEKFMENVGWLDDLKLRASWGRTGNQEIDNIARYTLYVSNYGEAGFGGQSYGTSYDIAGTNGGQQLASGFKRNQLGNDNADADAKTVKAFFNAMQKIVKGGLALAYHDRSDGGVAVTLAEMAITGGQGLSVTLPDADAAGNPLDPLAVLFSEEPGAVLQVADEKLNEVLAIFRRARLGDCVHVIGAPTGDRAFTIHVGCRRVLATDITSIRRAWSETTYRMQALRDNPASAKEEYDNGLDEADPGLTFKLTYDPDSGISGKSGRSGKTGKPRMAILREQGVNGHIEMAAAFALAGFESVDVHMTDLLAGRVDLAEFQGLVACGGFSYGDVLGAGSGWARTILFNRQLKAMFRKFFHRKDTFSLGVCNGCQMLSQLKDIIPGAEAWPEFKRNVSEQFEGRYCTLEVLESPSIFFKGMAGSRIPIAVAHGEGRVVFPAGVDAAKAKAALRYVDGRGNPTERYPWNPNGSAGGLTSFTTRDGRATIMMPHPERAFRACQLSYNDGSFKVAGPWMKMFRNAYAFATRGL